MEIDGDEGKNTACHDREVRIGTSWRVRLHEGKNEGGHDGSGTASTTDGGSLERSNHCNVPLCGHGDYRMIIT